MSSIQRTWCNTPLSKRSPTRCPHLDGVLHCLHQQASDQPVVPEMALSDHPHLQAVGSQPIDLHQYEQLLSSSG